MRSENLKQSLQTILNISVVRSWQTLRARLAPFSVSPSGSLTIQIVQVHADLGRLAADLDAEYERRVLRGTLGE